MISKSRLKEIFNSLSQAELMMKIDALTMEEKLELLDKDSDFLPFVFVALSLVAIENSYLRSKAMSWVADLFIEKEHNRGAIPILFEVDYGLIRSTLLSGGLNESTISHLMASPRLLQSMAQVREMVTTHYDLQNCISVFMAEDWLLLYKISDGNFVIIERGTDMEPMGNLVFKANLISDLNYLSSRSKFDSLLLKNIAESGESIMADDIYEWMALNLKRKFRDVKSIYLSDNVLSSPFLDLIKEAATSDIRVLNLSNNQLQAEEVIQLSAILSGNKTKLLELNLSYNYIDDGGAIALAALVASNNSLIKLDLRDNSIGLDGLHSLAQALKVNASIIEVNFNSNPVLLMEDGDDPRVNEALNIASNAILRNSFLYPISLEYLQEKLPSADIEKLFVENKDDFVLAVLSGFAMSFLPAGLDEKAREWVGKNIFSNEDKKIDFFREMIAKDVGRDGVELIMRQDKKTLFRELTDLTKESVGPDSENSLARVISNLRDIMFEAVRDRVVITHPYASALSQESKELAI